MATACLVSAGAFAQGWMCYGGNAQHNGAYTGKSQSASLIQWQAPLDDNRSYYGGSVLIHYAAPMITPANTVVYGYRSTTTSGGSTSYDHWTVLARKGATGVPAWNLPTDFSAVVLFPAGWTSVFPVTLYQLNTATYRGVAAAGSGGSILTRESADNTMSTTSRLIFYTTAADFEKNKAAYAPIKVNTPLTADTSGNIYFGYQVTGTIPTALSTKIGTGGIAKVNVVTGKTSYKPTNLMGVDASLSRPAINAAPALTMDSKFMYIAAVGNSPYLIKLATTDLTTAASVKLIDPSIANANVGLINESSASPMVGTDGHVFMGVFGNQWRESHGWMLQYDENLKATDAKGVRWPTGAFGWDDTACVVPKTMVPSYKGKATYLLLTKYNNYDMGGDAGADGSNKIAILDPSSNSISKDRQSGIAVMNEVLTVLGPTRTNDDSNHPQARNEWCINSAAIDINRKSAIINSEDGHMYRWDLTTNTLTENMNLQPPTGEAYTETAIGPDGQIYVINNSILFAIGSTPAVSVFQCQGSGASGGLTNILGVDGTFFTVKSTPTTTNQTAAIEADFTLPIVGPKRLDASVTFSAVGGVTGNVLVYNVISKQWDLLSTTSVTTAVTTVKFSVTTSVAKYIGPKGSVRIVVLATQPGKMSAKFTLAADQITCNVH